MYVCVCVFIRDLFEVKYQQYINVRSCVCGKYTL